MKKSLLFPGLMVLVCLLCFHITDAQNIRMKIPSFSGLPSNGEDLVAFEVSDTVYMAASGGGGGSAGKTVFEFAKIKKVMSASTNELWKRSLQGTHIPEVLFEFYNNSNSMFYSIALKDVTVRHFSYLSPECNNCPRLFHQVWFDYEKIEVTDVASGNTVKWDRSANAAY